MYCFEFHSTSYHSHHGWRHFQSGSKTLISSRLLHSHHNDNTVGISRRIRRYDLMEFLRKMSRRCGFLCNPSWNVCTESPRKWMGVISWECLRMWRAGQGVRSVFGRSNGGFRTIEDEGPSRTVGDGWKRTGDFLHSSRGKSHETFRICSRGHWWRGRLCCCRFQRDCRLNCGAGHGNGCPMATKNS